MGTKWDLTLGNGCADDVLLSCTLETGMVLLTNVTQINSMKNKISKMCLFKIVWQNFRFTQKYQKQYK